MAIGKPTLKDKKSEIFDGIHFFIELGVLSLQRKKELVSAIETNGGSVDFVISKKTTHVITHQDLLSSYKLKSAHGYGCFFVLEQFVTESINAEKQLEDEEYFLGETPAKRLENSFNENLSLVSAALNKSLFNIAGLCAGLGAQVPYNKPVTTIVNNLYNNVLFPKQVTRQKLVIHTPITRVIEPSPPAASSVPSSYRSYSSSSSSSSSSTKISSPSIFSSAKPTTPSSFSLSSSSTVSKSPVKAPLKSTTFSFSSSSSPSSSSTSLAPSSVSKFSSTFNSTPSSDSSKLNIPAAKTVSYSYAQYEAERRKQREEEKAKKAEEGGSVLRERENRRKEEEEARKKAMEDKKQELLEKRKEEDEARKQKNKELSEAREKRIQEERRKREIAIEKLKQKPTHDLLTSAFFQQWDQEESDMKMKQELEEHMKQMDAWKAQQEAKDKAAQQRAERLRVEKEKKALDREEKQRSDAAEKVALKNQRREEYFNNKESEALKKKQEFEEKQAKLLEEYTKRQAKRERKALLGLHPELQVNYDKHKIFVGGIKMEDIKVDKKLPQAQADRIRSERVNAILRMFDSFGEVHKRSVFADKPAAPAHCFITFKEKASVAKAVEAMKDFEERKKRVETAKAEIESRKLPALCVPHPSFYVRIPKEKKGKKNQKAEETVEEEDDGAEWQEAPATKGSKPSAAPTVPSIIPTPVATAPTTITRLRPALGPRSDVPARRDRPIIRPTSSSSVSPSISPREPTPIVARVPFYRPPPPKPKPMPTAEDPLIRKPISVAPNTYCNLEIEDDSDNDSDNGSSDNESSDHESSDNEPSYY